MSGAASCRQVPHRRRRRRDDDGRPRKVGGEEYRMRVGFRQKVFSRNSRQHTRPPMYFRKLSLVEPSSSCGLGLAAFTVDRWRFHTHTRPARSGAQNALAKRHHATFTRPDCSPQIRRLHQCPRSPLQFNREYRPLQLKADTLYGHRVCPVARAPASIPGVGQIGEILI